jgi:hypothetical protein
MHFFGDYFVVVKNAADNTITCSHLYDRYLTALSALSTLTQRYPQPDYYVSLRTMKHIPSLRGHPEANVRNIARKEQIPEEVLMQAWAYDNDNSRNFERKIVFLARKYLYILFALSAWIASFVLSSMLLPRTASVGIVLLAAWAATILFLYLHEKEWGFALFIGLCLFVSQAFIERIFMYETYLMSFAR